MAELGQFETAGWPQCKQCLVKCDINISYFSKSRLCLADFIFLILTASLECRT